jgi:hypothetical protein
MKKKLLCTLCLPLLLITCFNGSAFAQDKTYQDAVDRVEDVKKENQEKLPRDTAAEALLFRIARLQEVYARSHSGYVACTGTECADELDAKDLKNKLMSMPVSVKVQDGGKRFVATVKGKEPVGLLMWDSKEPGVEVVE